MKALRTGLLAAATVLLLAGCSGKEKSVSIEMVATSDVHGNFFPYDFVSSSEEPVSGSLARVKSWLDDARNEYGDRLLLFDAGDMIQGSPVTYQDKVDDYSGKSVAALLLNDLGYQAAVPGNHDFESGLKTLDKYMQTADFPLLCANLLISGTHLHAMTPYCMIERDGLRIAVVGMSTPYASFKIPPSAIDGYAYSGVKESAAGLIPEIREKEHPHIIVGVFHSGLEDGMSDGLFRENETMETALAVPGFDVIFYGHDHIPACSKIANCNGDSVLLINSGAYADNLAVVRLDVTMKGDSVLSCSIVGNVESLSDIQPDENLLTRYKSKMDDVRMFQDSVIGTVDADLSGYEAIFGPSAVTSLFNTSILSWDACEISISSPYSENLSIPAGPVTMRDLWNLYPYENNMTCMWLKGRDVVDVLEYFSGRWMNTIRTDNDTLVKVVRTEDGYELENRIFDFMTAGGIDYTVDITKPVGQRVNVISMSDGTPFDADRLYRVGVSSFLASGGYEPFCEALRMSGSQMRRLEVVSTMSDYRYSLISKFITSAEKNRPVHVETSSNWKLIPEGLAAKAVAKCRELPGLWRD